MLEKAVLLRTPSPRCHGVKRPGEAPYKGSYTMSDLMFGGIPILRRC